MGRNNAQDPVVAWLRSARTAPLSSDLAPGTNAEQRTRLAAVGGLVRLLVPREQVDRWPDALQAWIDEAPKPPPSIAHALTQTSQSHPDRFASLYCELVAGVNRRRLGTFFTPEPIVDFMLNTVPRPAGRYTLVDPGAGVGAFALAAASRWSHAEVFAVDVNVVTLGLLGAAASVAGVHNVTLVHDDYLNWLQGRDRQEDPPRLLVGNPPYTRHQELDSKLKKAMREAAQDLVTSGLAGLSAYFLASSFNSMRPDDRLCFVLPTTWSEARYGQELREWLWRETHRRVEMHLFPAGARVFPGTRVAAMVLYVGPQQGPQESFTRHVATLGGVKVTTSGGQSASRDDEVPRSFGPWLWRHADPSPRDHVPLGDLGRVRRGVATGANSFFFLTDDDAANLPDSAVRPALRRLRHVVGDVLDTAEHRRIGLRGDPRWLLMLDNADVAANPQVQFLLERGRRAGVPDRYLARVREPWYVVEDVSPPHLLVAMMTKERIRVVRNVAKVIPSNSMYGIYLKKSSLARSLAEWMNSAQGQRALLARTRHYSEGLRKLEPRDLSQVLVPTPAALASN